LATGRARAGGKKRGAAGQGEEKEKLGAAKNRKKTWGMGRLTKNEVLVAGDVGKRVNTIKENGDVKGKNTLSTGAAWHPVQRRMTEQGGIMSVVWRGAAMKRIRRFGKKKRGGLKNRQTSGVVGKQTWGEKRSGFARKPGGGGPSTGSKVKKAGC